ncbi:Alpha/Beta hydrolase protein [Protomyces lactucae-debilis]|uniref:Alpha/Beta hydrolase protein n=1 Tax=Protomyces lactucae-debilis TaxID=2754530 RepID=A0A1Y2F345_PROLT|nr:Alpha/Beta hydrolase protein [Protomyces lactucae-debilis]ORY77756.1 Alpha/Beta hydrolase protein [Protomyces lactucae-debilis]
MDFSAAAFDPELIDPEVNALNQYLIQVCQKEADEKLKWWDIGAQEYRDRFAAGLCAVPKPVILEHRDVQIQSRDAGRTIPVRVMSPGDEAAAKGIFIHIHGGGWVLFSAASQDPYLTRLAKGTGCVVLSIEYRLAPEYPSPSPENDCFDVCEAILNGTDGILPTNSPARKRIFAGGESAGGHLTMLTALAIKAKLGKSLNGLVLNYGVFDLSVTPSAMQSTVPLVLCRDDIPAYLKAYLPDAKTTEDFRDPAISPLYAKLDADLPPALFQCGTLDCFLDDTLFMAARYTAAGNRTITKIYPGASHGVTTIFQKQGQATVDAMIAFVSELL